MPWVHLIVGEAQFRCMMSFLWENMYEDADFGPPRPAVYPPGAQKVSQGLGSQPQGFKHSGCDSQGLGHIKSAPSRQRQVSVSAAAACSLHACSAGRKRTLLQGRGCGSAVPLLVLHARVDEAAGACTKPPTGDVGSDQTLQALRPSCKTLLHQRCRAEIEALRMA